MLPCMRNSPPENDPRAVMNERPRFPESVCGRDVVSTFTCHEVQTILPWCRLDPDLSSQFRRLTRSTFACVSPAIVWPSPRERRPKHSPFPWIEGRIDRSQGMSSTRGPTWSHFLCRGHCVRCSQGGGACQARLSTDCWGTLSSLVWPALVSPGVGYRALVALSWEIHW